MSYLAICAIGGVMTTLYVPYRAAEMESLLGHSRARAFIGLDGMGDFRPAQTGLDLRSRIASLEHVIVLGDVPEGACSFADLANAAPHDLSDGPVSADPFLLLYTSGTSARPKGVPLAYQGILGNARLGAPEHGITNTDRILSAAPFGHLYALYSFHLALAAGASTVLLPAFTPPDLARTLEAEAVAVLFAAPAHVAACLGAGLLNADALSALRLAVLSGSAVAPSVAKGLQERMANGHVTQLWGMTETQAGLYTRPGDSIATVASSAGRPSPGTEVRVVGPDDTALPAGEEGELHIRGSLLFPGYFENPEANRDAFSAGGWFRTGDLAVVAADGNVAITGRCKDVINRGGIKYNPRDIEDLLAAHPQVDMAAIVPVPDPVLGERACCCITVAGDTAPTLEAVCVYLEENGIAKVRWPERLEVFDSMPLTATRKIIKGKLIRRLQRAMPRTAAGGCDAHVLDARRVDRLEEVLLARALGALAVAEREDFVRFVTHSVSTGGRSAGAGRPGSGRVNRGVPMDRAWSAAPGSGREVSPKGRKGTGSRGMSALRSTPRQPFLTRRRRLPDRHGLSRRSRAARDPQCAAPRCLDRSSP